MTDRDVMAQAEAEAEAEAQAEADGREKVVRVLNGLGIRRVIFVDDDFDMTDREEERAALLAAVPRLRTAFRESLSKSAGGFLSLPVQEEDLDDDDIRTWLDGEWPGFNTEEKAAILAQKTIAQRKNVGDEEIEDARTIIDLRKALPPEIQYVPLKVTEWDTQKDILFESAYEPTLLFFDRDLGEFGGPKAGEALLAAVHERQLSSVYYGLLTHDATTLIEEMTIADDLQQSIKAAVSVMGKKKLNELSDFAEALRVFVYKTDLEKMRTLLKASLAQASEEAAAFLEKLSSYSLMAAVEASAYEGDLEPAGIVRLTNGIIRRSFEQSLRTQTHDEMYGSLRIAGREKISAYLPQHPDLATVQWNDRFETQEHLGNARLPLEAGDIFQITDKNGDEKTYILLVQACDLMMRIDGRTNASSSLTLALVKERPVNERASEKEQENMSSGGEKYVSLGQYDPAGDVDWVVDLTKTIHVSPQLLDACVLNADGRSLMPMAGYLSAGLSDGWAKRAKGLHRWRGQKVKEAQELDKLVPKDVKGDDRRALQSAMFANLLGPGCATGEVQGTIDIKKQVVEASIVRVSRLVTHDAGALLVLASQHQARPDLLAPLFKTQRK